MSPRTLPILPLSFAGTIIVALWALDFSTATKPKQPDVTGLTPSGSIPVQTRLDPRPPLALEPINGIANKSAVETTSSQLPFGDQAPQSFFHPDVRSDLPRTLADNALAPETQFAGQVASFNDRGTATSATRVESGESAPESLRPSASMITQFSSVAVNQLESSDPVPKPIVLPAALKEIASDTIPSPLTSEQEFAVTRVQDSFVEEIGGEEQAANDPQYKDRWMVAQPIADQRLRAQIGDQAYREYQKALVRSAVATKGNVVP